MPWFRMLTTLVVVASTAVAQTPLSSPPKPADTEVWNQFRRSSLPGRTNADPSSDGVVLFDGKNLDAWGSVRDGSPAKWSSLTVCSR